MPALSGAARQLPRRGSQEGAAARDGDLRKRASAADGLRAMERLRGFLSLSTGTVLFDKRQAPCLPLWGRWRARSAGRRGSAAVRDCVPALSGAARQLPRRGSQEGAAAWRGTGICRNAQPQPMDCALWSGCAVSSVCQRGRFCLTNAKPLASPFGGVGARAARDGEGPPRDGAACQPSQALRASSPGGGAKKERRRGAERGFAQTRKCSRWVARYEAAARFPQFVNGDGSV